MTTTQDQHENLICTFLFTILFYKGPYLVWFGWIKTKIKVGLVDIDFEMTITLCFVLSFFIFKIIEPYEPVNFIGHIFSPFATIISSELFTPRKWSFPIADKRVSSCDAVFRSYFLYHRHAIKFMFNNNKDSCKEEQQDVRLWVFNSFSFRNTIVLQDDAT